MEERGSCVRDRCVLFGPECICEESSPESLSIADLKRSISSKFYQNGREALSKREQNDVFECFEAPDQLRIIMY